MTSGRPPTTYIRRFEHTLPDVRDDRRIPGKSSSHPVVCDAAAIHQVILALVVNAAQAIQDVVRRSGRRGTIRVASRRDGPEVVISVSDDGCGISDADRRARLRAVLHDEPVGRGTGQSLAVARNVVQRHRGRITFTSSVGAGSTFVVALPVAGEAGGRDPDVEREGPAASCAHGEST